MGSNPVEYADEPEDGKGFTQAFDEFYTTFAPFYDLSVKVLPFWRRWLDAVLPHLRGPRVLEISFGTGYLLTRFAHRFRAYGLDYNHRLAVLARDKLESRGMSANIHQGDAQALSYQDAAFDTIVNTMAFTVFPDGQRAMAEIHRVLKPGGVLVIVDVGFPSDRNWLGMQLARMWITMGDIIRDMDTLFQRFSFDYTAEPIGGFGSVHLYVSEKR
jgi:ubiquinone/menaquinone biosynthesis C-methylase UbiE